MCLRGQPRHAGQDEVHELAGAPAEVPRARDAQADELGREQLDGRVEGLAATERPEVAVVVHDDAHDADEAVEHPDEEAGPDVRARLRDLCVVVAAKKEDPGQGYAVSVLSGYRAGTARTGHRRNV